MPAVTTLIAPGKRKRKEVHRDRIACGGVLIVVTPKRRTKKGGENEMKEISRSIVIERMSGWRAGIIVPVVLMAILAVSISPASAIVKPFTAVLTGGQEVPQNESEAFGVAFMTLDTIAKMLCYSITFNDLGSDETAAHFHGPAAPAQDADVIFAITPVPGKAKNGCVGPLSTQQVRQLNKGQLYINIHTVSFPGGEIRGQVLPVPANVKY
ncbi:MAG: CHRD domain-containing protein [Nitrospirota bacterium]